jgi:hypothetical protein
MERRFFQLTIRQLWRVFFISVWIPALAGISLSNPKYEKWLRPSFFRGYNLLYHSPKSYQDFLDFKKIGGNSFHIAVWGFIGTDKPYDTLKAHIDSTDKMVKYCDSAGIYYTIAVRSGPGAYDVYLEMIGETPESRIWDKENVAERRLYAEMLKMIVSRYRKDTLFVGVNVIVEPRPKVWTIPAPWSGLYKRFLEGVFNINMNDVYEYFVREIRKVNTEIPVIIENFAFSTPELFPPYKINDPYIVYDTHVYSPFEFTKAPAYSKLYPGKYKSIVGLAPEMYDRTFLRETVLGRVREFQIHRDVPMLIGEFGLMNPQSGGEQFLSDVMDICLEYGWHFALWEWRNGQKAWNLERFGEGKYMEIVEQYFRTGLER